MKLVGLKRLQNFMGTYPDAKAWIENWAAEVRDSKWNTPQDIKNRYRSASFLSNNIVIFNVKGNAYRLAVQVAFKSGVVAVKRIGTHSEYNRWTF